jgi:hypothetical protein
VDDQPVATQAPARPTMIHWSELPEDKAEGGNSTEWNFYRREVGRLLTEGHEGRWVLIKGEQIIGIWDTSDEAMRVLNERYALQPCLLHQVRAVEPLLRISYRVFQCLK